MGATDEQVVRSMYAGFSTLASGGEIAAYVRAHFDPAVEYRPVEELEPIRGHAAMIAWNERWFEAWEEFSAHVEELTETGARVVTGITIRGRGSGSGSEADMRVFHVFELRDGLILRMGEYLEREQALAAAERG